MEPRAGVRRGYLLLADISGYTSFFARSEIEHAQDILRELLQALLSRVEPPLVVCELEGDAVFAYAPEGSFLQGQTLLELVENLYVAFSAARERMHVNTTCTCTACRLIPELDLKFVVHHGAFVLQQIDPRHAAKPSGPEVIRVHRLLKNRIPEATGIPAYALFTEDCVRASRLESLAGAMLPHTEHYEHLGAVAGYVHDLHPVWIHARARRRVQVDPAEGWIEVDAHLPAPPPVAWDYFNEPGYALLWRESDSLAVAGPSGRTGVGSSVHCAHGKRTVVEEIVDWRPFAYLTVDVHCPLGAVLRGTALFEVEEEGTRLTYRVAQPVGRNGLHTGFVRLVYAMLRGHLRGEYTRALVNLRRLIARGLARGDGETENGRWEMDAGVWGVSERRR